MHEYRDRVYIMKDILLNLSEHGDLNQTSLLSYCGLNLVKHREILWNLEQRGFIKKTAMSWGTKKIVKYSVTAEGREFSEMVLEPYEQVFPRGRKSN